MDSSVLFKKDNDVFGRVALLYERTEESLKEDVRILRNWMRTQPHLPEVMDDDMIRNFFILNKCSIEATKRRIDTYYTIRSQINDIYDYINLKRPNMQLIMRIGAWVTLPQLTEEMHRVVWFRMLDKSLIDQVEPFDIFGMAMDLYEIRLKEDLMFGDVVVFDTKGLNLNYATKLTPSVMAKMFTIYEKIFSIPMEKLLLLNASAFIDVLLTVMKNFMRPKVFQKILISSDASILSEHFSKEMIPKDYGGEGLSIKELQDLLIPKLEQYQHRFDELDRMRVDESLRPEKCKNDETLGFHGNFRNFFID